MNDSLNNETALHLIDRLCDVPNEELVVSVEPVIHLPGDDPFILDPAQLFDKSLILPLDDSISQVELNIGNFSEQDGNLSDKSDDTVILSAADISSLLQKEQNSEGHLPTRGRKRQRNTEDWKRNVKKRRRQSGLAYESRSGKHVRARELKTRKDCEGKCRYKCSALISNSERERIFNSFWSMSDTEKFHFYRKTLERTEKERIRTRSKKSRRQYSIKYNFDIGERRVRVCKEYYLSTLDISQRRVQWFFSNKNLSSPSSLEDKRGKFPKKSIPEKAKNVVRQHIKSFPHMPSHYCRASSNREYLESDLNVAKMYELYKEKCKKAKIKPQKIHVYREIFNTEFNLGFYTPQKDRCDICEEAKASEKNFTMSAEDKLRFGTHITGKQQTKLERDKDRNRKEIVVCFDMQNVLVCPRANVSNFYYKRKLNVFNLTAHCSRNKKAYNCIWSESEAGRGGNEIANALIKILSEVTNDIPNIERIILWSDSCVPQNRNSIMTFALKSFLSKHKSIKLIEQKFCEPGHSCIQEVDNIHSHIEKYLALSEIYSPVSLIRVLLKVRPKSSRVIQLRSFVNYQRVSNMLNFSVVPYTKVKYIKIQSGKDMFVTYKTSFSDEENEIEVSIGKQVRGKSHFDLPEPASITSIPVIGKEKLKDFRSMLKYMPLLDQKYFETILNKGKEQPKEKVIQERKQRELTSRKKLRKVQGEANLKGKTKSVKSKTKLEKKKK